MQESRAAPLRPHVPEQGENGKWPARAAAQSRRGKRLQIFSVVNAVN